MAHDYQFKFNYEKKCFHNYCQTHYYQQSIFIFRASCTTVHIFKPILEPFFRKKAVLSDFLKAL